MPEPAGPEPPGQRRSRGRPARRTALVALPAVLGLALWAAARTGAVADPRIGVRVSALLGDWLLAAGLLATLLLAVPALVAARAGAAQRRALDAAAAAAARDRRLLLSRLDHELKNPLTAMRAAVANAAAAGPGDARTAALRSIEEQVLRLSRLTADLRKIADVETGVLDRRPVDLAAVLQEAVEVVLETPASAGRRLRLDLPQVPWPLPPVLGDEDLLGLAVVNLVDNALKYTPVGGAVEVRAREAGGQVVVEVADTGPGIPSGELPHIWEELYRSPRARTVPGSGLGLPLVRAVVERHGGAVEADSRVGRGTVVRLRLPADRVPDPEPRAPGPLRERHGGATPAP